VSFYRVSDDEQDLAQIIAAIAASSGQIQAIQYILIDEQVVRDLDISIVVVPGNTPHTDVNGLHRDLDCANDERHSALASMMAQVGERGLRLKNQVKELVISAIEAAHLSIDQLEPKAREQIATFRQR
jgi:hypothetical protein